MLTGRAPASGFAPFFLHRHASGGREGEVAGGEGGETSSTSRFTTPMHAALTYDSQHAIPNLTACSAYGGELKTTMHRDCFVGYV